MATLLILACILFIFLFALVVLLLRSWIRNHSRHQLQHLQGTPHGQRNLVVGFFHPYCNAGGGGERVLWVAVRALQRRYPEVKCVVYTGDVDATAEQIVEKARQRFNITLPKPVEFVFLKRRKWVEARKYPIFTLLGQSFGSIILGFEALLLCVPDIYIDSMGYAFTLPLFKYFGGCKVGCYVHYPTISTDMLDRVSQGAATYNNASFVSRSWFLTGIKVIYYRMFAYLYGLAGNRSDVVMVNSTWTYGHIKYLWNAGDRAVIVYPPCDISEFIKIPLTDRCADSTSSILSIAQFRPEKNHALQLNSFQEFLEGQPEKTRSQFHLVLVGGCRDDKDRQRVEELKSLTKQLNLQDNVEFKLNVSFESLKELMASSVIGLHTMVDEHFGIGIVELMAAGTVILANDSAGPKMDIVIPHGGYTTGFLAKDVESYAAAMTEIFSMSIQQRLEICDNARKSVARFSESEFEHGFLTVVEPLIEPLAL